MNETEKPLWMQWYAQKYRNDAALQSCSLAARGFAANFFSYTGCESPIRGMFLMDNGQRPTMSQTARLCSCSEDEASAAIAELVGAGAIKRTTEGTLYSAFQVRMAKRADSNSRNAKSRWAKRMGGPSSYQGVGASGNANGHASDSVGDSKNEHARSLLSSLSSDLSSGGGVQRGADSPLGRSVTPLPKAGDEVEPDAAGGELVRGAYNASCGDRPKCVRLLAPELSALFDFLRSEPAARVRAFWEDVGAHASKAKAKHWNSEITLGWLLTAPRGGSFGERIAALLRGDFDHDRDAQQNPKPLSTYRRPAGGVDYSKPLDDERDGDA